MSPRPQGDPKWLLTGVIGHQLLQAVELGAGGDVEAATVQLADLVVLHVEPLGVVKVRDGEAVGTCGQDRGAGGGDAPQTGAPHGVPLRGGGGGAGLGMQAAAFTQKQRRRKEVAVRSVIWAWVIPAAPPAPAAKSRLSIPTGCANKGHHPLQPPQPHQVLLSGNTQHAALLLLPLQRMLLLAGGHSGHHGSEELAPWGWTVPPQAGTEEETPLGVGGPSGQEGK